MTTWGGRKLAVLASVLLIPSMVATASEVDNFTDRKQLRQILPDSSEVFDRKINSKLREMEQALNDSPPHTPEERVALMRSTFSSAFFSSYIVPLESWACKSLPRYTAKGLGIYGGKVDFTDTAMSWYVGIASTIKLSGILMGTDKVGHFFGLGLDYYILYQELSAKNPAMSEKEKLDRVRRLGDELESGPLGIATTGVYSYGDLAANWEGFRFFRELFAPNQGYFEQRADGRYVLRRVFAIRDYATDDFDEVLNPSRIRDQRFYDHIRGNFGAICSEYRSDPAAFVGASGSRMELSEFTWSGYDHLNKPLRLEIEQLCKQPQ